MPNRVLRLAFLVLVSTTAVLAQDRSSSRVFGQVRDADGNAWAKAKVHLVARPMSRDFSSPLHRLVVVVDGEGRFRAELKTGLRYSVWAQEEGVGSYKLSQIEEGVQPGMALILKQYAQRSTSQSLTWTGIRAWKSQMPLRCRFVAATQNVFESKRPVSEAGLVDLPHWPGYACHAILFGKDGYPLAEAAITLGEGRVRRHVKPPLACEISVQGEGGDALVGVSISVESRFVEYRVAKLEGPVATVAVPRPSGRLSATIHASACVPGMISQRPGRGVGRSVFSFLGGKKNPKFDAVLMASRSLRGRIVAGSGHPLAHAILRVHSATRNQHGSGGYHRTLRTDSEGRFEIDKLDAEVLPVVYLVLDELHRGLLPEPWRKGLHSVVPLLLPSPGKQGPKDLGDMDLLGFCPIEITVEDRKGDPESRAILRLLTTERTRRSYIDHYRWVGDQSGRLRLLLPPSESWLAWIAGKDTAAYAGLGVQRGHERREVARATWRLGEPCLIEGVVSDRRGKPTAGASISIFAPRSVHYPVPHEELEVEDAPRLVIWRDFQKGAAGNLVSEFLSGQGQVSGEDGRYRVVIPRGIGLLSVSAVAHPWRSSFGEVEVGDQAVLEQNLELKFR